MIGFKPFKRRANEFKYTPRFYDPAKEERDRRRAELRGSRPEGEDMGDYVPGEYIRRQREAREQRLARTKSRKHSSSYLVMGIAVVFLIGYLILPRIIDLFMSVGKEVEQIKPVDEYQDFDPYAPIRIVPNDYAGE